MELAAGIAKKAETDYYKLDEEYRKNVDIYAFRLSIAMRQQMKKMQEQMIASQMSSKIIMDNENKVMEPQQMQQPMPQPTQQPQGVSGASPLI